MLRTEPRWNSDLIGKKTVNKEIYTSAFLLHFKNYVKIVTQK